MIFVGIDPGKHGAVVALNERGLVQWIWKTPLVSHKGKTAYDVAAMREILADLPTDARVALEVQQARPKQGVSSTFSTGRGYGLWEGLLAGMQISHVLVRPQAWQKVVLAGYPKPLGPKVRALQCAQALWPNLKWLKSKDGPTDAACIAEWLRRQGSAQPRASLAV